MKIAFLFMLSQYFDLMSQALDYSKYSKFFILGFCYLLALQQLINVLYHISNIHFPKL